jgi:hypothetical protein
MRNLIITALITAVAACGGPSSKDVASAKLARYQGDKLQLFAVMKQTVEDKYKLEVSDETKLALKTAAKWYTPDGLVSNWTPEDGRGTKGVSKSEDGRSGTMDKSLNISLVAQLLPENEKWVVHIEPVVLRYNEGQPKLEPVRPDDPSLPGFVKGKSDELAYDVHKKLKQWEVKSPGGLAPPPASPEPAPVAPAPAEGSGSAAPQ